jgi:hypothetical protein
MSAVVERAISTTATMSPPGMPSGEYAFARRTQVQPFNHFLTPTFIRALKESGAYLLAYPPPPPPKKRRALADVHPDGPQQQQQQPPAAATRITALKTLGDTTGPHRATLLVGVVVACKVDGCVSPPICRLELIDPTTCSHPQSKATRANVPLSVALAWLNSVGVHVPDKMGDHTTRNSVVAQLVGCSLMLWETPFYRCPNSLPQRPDYVLHIPLHSAVGVDSTKRNRVFKPPAVAHVPIVVGVDIVACYDFTPEEGPVRKGGGRLQLVKPPPLPTLPRAAAETDAYSVSSALVAWAAGRGTNQQHLGNAPPQESVLSPLLHTLQSPRRRKRPRLLAPTTNVHSS